jgi:sugar lactone lactonase YvrE
MTRVTHVSRTVAEGFRLPESLRWHDGRLWMSDMDGKAVYVVGPNGPELVCEVPAQPSGLGWDPDGKLLIVSQLDALLLRFDGTSLHLAADLGPVMRARGGDVRPNDMYVDEAGTAFIGSVSFEVVGDRLVAEDSRPTPLVKVTRDGTVSTLTDELRCPNGIVPAISGDGLIVAETRSARLVTVAPSREDAASATVTVYTPCASGPDGICTDSEGAVWAALPFAGVVQRLDRDGAVLDEIDLGGRVPLDCTLDGANGTSLFVASVAAIDHLGTSRTGRIDVYELGGDIAA